MDFNPSLQIASQSSLDCSEAQGLVSSIYGHARQHLFYTHIRTQHTCINRRGWEERGEKKDKKKKKKKTHVVDTKLIQSLGNLNLLLGIKKGIGELLTLTQSALDDLKARNVAQEVGHSSVMAVRVTRSSRVRVLTGFDTSKPGVGRRI